MEEWILRSASKKSCNGERLAGRSLTMMCTNTASRSRLASPLNASYRCPMSAWPGAHAGFGVDGAAPDLAPAGDAWSVLHAEPQLAGRLPARTAEFDGGQRQRRFTRDAFGCSRSASLLRLATAGQLVTADDAICSVSRVVSQTGRRRMALCTRCIDRGPVARCVAGDLGRTERSRACRAARRCDGRGRGRDGQRGPAVRRLQTLAVRRTPRIRDHERGVSRTRPRGRPAPHRCRGRSSRSSRCSTLPAGRVGQ